MRYDPADAQLFVRNRARLTAKLKDNSVAILHSNDIMPTNADGTMLLKQNTDLYYLCGIDQEESVLLLFPDAKNKKDREILFIRETNEQIAIWEGNKLSKEQASALSGIENVQWVDQFELYLHRLIQQSEYVYLNTNEYLRPPVSVQTRDARFLKQCQSHYPLHKYERLSPLMRQLRIIKDAEEIKMLQQACDITEAGFRRILGFVQPGVGEWEVEAEYMHEFLRRKSRGFAYSPIIGSGKNACVLHYLENQDVCEDGDLLLMDVAAEYGNWNADMTRTIPVNGKFTDRQRAVYNAVLRVLRKANEILRPGMLPTEYQKQVTCFMEEELIHLGLIDAAEAAKQDASRPLVKKYFMHGTSHHLGLDVHDICPVEEPFAVGMVFTIEPGIYIREENIGVRLENDVVIEEHGNVDLMANIPIEADEIEALMNA
ncbi:aminopeptidase P N-terminal domain-containing protein [Verrucomicrobiaceae bacterium 5K15]|uniref:Xaa-Pro aminopeptidase n=1 Tax=Oceaniferula flava TaxID=2800421 RepID=A0AAE2SAN0_9BACT|nr:aminopeptidase P N-terminal domain-containing protein [Oceaniferula flavus]MBK1853457.1 aminopeptidase P N-terminal domain-containing protein [Oceaniferula flavus]MBM1134762.1 aminopeptidase P N-terminal domain-containing protein [Oceaniferula flavus]